MAAPIFKYKLPTVGTLNDLFEDYPDGGVYGAFAYVSTAGKYAWWNHTLPVPQWELTTLTPETPPVAIQEPDKVTISDIPLLRYLKDPVATVSELLARYPEGGEYGWFCIIQSENKIAWWNDSVTPARWQLLGGGGGSIGGGGGDLYTNPNKVPTTLGGIAANTTFNEKTMQEMWDALLYPESNPTVEDPTYSVSCTRNLVEVGSTIQVDLVNNFNPGVINPIYIYDEEAKEWKSGGSIRRVAEQVNGADTHTYSGHVNGQYPIAFGSNTFERTVTFPRGRQPLTSKGNAYREPYPNATDATGSFTRSVTITGVYPIYATTALESNVITLVKQGLQSHGSEIIKTLAPELGGSQTLKIPYSVTIDSTVHYLWLITKAYVDFQGNWIPLVINNTAEKTIDTDFEVTTETIGGVTYKVYTQIKSASGWAKYKFTV